MFGGRKTCTIFSIFEEKYIFCVEALEAIKKSISKSSEVGVVFYSFVMTLFLVV
jgi:hypothetical protein